MSGACGANHLIPRAALACVPAPGRDGEDHGAVGPGVAVVVDGVGLPPGGCVHGVAWYARNLAHATLAAVADPAVALADGLATAIAAVAARHPGCDLARPDTQAAAVGVLRLGDIGAETLSLADVTVVLDLGDDVRTVVDRHAADRAGLVGAGLAGHRIGTPGHAAAVAGLLAERATACNRPDGFWVAAADPSVAAMATTVTVPGVWRAAVCSDGASWPADDGVWTWPEYLGLLAAIGPAGVVAAVRDLEHADPDGVVHPRLKRHDDATIAFVEAPPC